MNRHILRAAAAALVLSTASVVAFTNVASPAYAAQRGRAAEAPAVKLPPLRASVGKPLNEAVKFTNMKDWDGAMHEALEADKIEMKTPYEEYKVAQLLGFISINKQPQDLNAATAAYNRMVASGAAPDMDKPGMLDTAMRLNMTAMDYPKAIQAAAELQKIQPLDDTGYQVLASAYYQTNDFVNAAATAKASLTADAAAGKKPNGDMLGLLLNSQAKTKDEAGYRQTLDTLATVSAQPEVWGQVMDFAFATKNISDHQLLNLYRLSMRVGTMKADDYKAIASIDLASGLPAEGKAVIAKGNITGDLVGQANTLFANDQSSLPTLAAEAAKTTANGEIDVKLGESYWSYGRFPEAVASLQKGIEKGGLKDLADAQTTLGVVLLDAGKKDEAQQAFDKAAATSSSAAPVAHAWSLFVRRAAGA